MRRARPTIDQLSCYALPFITTTATYSASQSMASAFAHEYSINFCKNPIPIIQKLPAAFFYPDENLTGVSVAPASYRDRWNGVIGGGPGGFRHYEALLNSREEAALLLEEGQGRRDRLPARCLSSATAPTTSWCKTCCSSFYTWRSNLSPSNVAAPFLDMTRQ